MNYIIAVSSKKENKHQPLDKLTSGILYKGIKLFLRKNVSLQ